MPWFSTCLVFKVENQSNIEHIFYEDMWMILQADDENSACDKALEEGHKHNESFSNIHSEIISWSFLGRKSIKEISLDENLVVIHSESKKQLGFINQAPTKPLQTAQY